VVEEWEMQGDDGQVGLALDTEVVSLGWKREWIGDVSRRWLLLLVRRKMENEHV